MKILNFLLLTFSFILRYEQQSKGFLFVLADHKPCMSIDEFPFLDLELKFTEYAQVSPYKPSQKSMHCLCASCHYMHLKGMVFCMAFCLL